MVHQQGRKQRVARIVLLCLYMFLAVAGVLAWIGVAMVGEWMRVQAWKEWGWIPR